MRPEERSDEGQQYANSQFYKEAIMDWSSLEKIFKALEKEEKPVLIYYDIGHGLECAGALIKRVSDEGFKLEGHFWIGFINLIKVSCGDVDVVIYEKGQEMLE